MGETVAQDIEVGPVHVDTGDDWMDLGFVIVLLVVVAVIAIVVRRGK